MAGKTEEAICKCGHGAGTHGHVPAIGYEGPCEACDCPGLDPLNPALICVCNLSLPCEVHPASDELTVEAIEAAAKSLANAAGEENWREWWGDAEAAIRAADEARGMRTEEAQLHLPARLYRLVSIWVPVDNKDRP